jgi:hypothetical protein
VLLFCPLDLGGNGVILIDTKKKAIASLFKLKRISMFDNYYDLMGVRIFFLHSILPTKQ